MGRVRRGAREEREGKGGEGGVRVDGRTGCEEEEVEGGVGG